jgi:hypothetical protein
VVRLKIASGNDRLGPKSAAPSFDPLRTPQFEKFFPPVETESTLPNP